MTRAAEAANRLKPTAEKLKKIVDDKIAATDGSRPQRRKRYLEIFDATVPDPSDIGLELE